MGQIIISLLVFAVWLASYWIDTAVLGYSDSSKAYTRLTYIFAHASFFHMAMNLFAFNMLMRSVRKLKLKIPLITAILASSIGTFFATYAIPTVGLSGVCFALLGALLVKIHNRDFMISVGIVLIAQWITFIINSSVNVPLHISSLIIGFILTYLFNYDYKRTKEGR